MHPLYAFLKPPKAPPPPTSSSSPPEPVSSTRVQAALRSQRGQLERVEKLVVSLGQKLDERRGAKINAVAGLEERLEDVERALAKLAATPLSREVVADVVREAHAKLVDEVRSISNHETHHRLDKLELRLKSVEDTLAPLGALLPALSSMLASTTPTTTHPLPPVASPAPTMTNPPAPATAPSARDVVDQPVIPPSRDVVVPDGRRASTRKRPRIPDDEAGDDKKGHPSFKRMKPISLPRPPHRPRPTLDPS